MANAAAPLRLAATVLVADLRGFAPVAMPAGEEGSAARVAEIFAPLADVAVAHHGVIEGLSGSALTLLFGPPCPQRDDAERALRAALEMQRAMLAVRNRWTRSEVAGGEEIGIAAGVASGEIEWRESAPRAAHDPDTRARQLAAAAARGEVLVDLATYERAGSALARRAIFTECDCRSGLRAYRCQPRRPSLRAVESEPIAVDPVCRRPVGAHATPRHVWQGVTYRFCSDECRERFVAEPRNFVE